MTSARIIVAGCLTIVIAVGGCGVTGDAGGGSSNPPTSGAGPYRRLAADPSITRIAPPLVLVDPNADLDDPFVIADGERLRVWVTARRAGGTRIEAAVADRLTDGFGPLTEVLAAQRPWEGAGVAGPSLTAGSPSLLFYAAGGAIGYSVSLDGGATFANAAGPTLEADNALEGTALGPPAAVRLTDGARGDLVRVYYPAAGALWAAEARLADLVAGGSVAWLRLDGDPLTPARDPMLRASDTPYATSLGRPFARAAATPTGRIRHDLFFTAATGLRATPTAIGFAASFTGDSFRAAPIPLLPLLPPPPRSPTMTPYGAGSLLLFVQPTASHAAIAAALSP